MHPKEIKWRLLKVRKFIITNNSKEKKIMKNNTTKVLLATVFSLLVTSTVSASEEDYDLAGYATSVVHQNSQEPLYDGAEADLFTYNSSSYSPVEFHKVSIFNENNIPTGTIFGDPLYYSTNH